MIAYFLVLLIDWGLRNYFVEGQIGQERTWHDYITVMVTICNELKRVMKEGGSMWINIGDTFWGGGGATGVPYDWESISTTNLEKYPQNGAITKNKCGCQVCVSKQKIGIPYRLRIALNDIGLISRDDIIWRKDNHMPGSQTDRFTNSYEFLFRFVKNTSKKTWWRNNKTKEWAEIQPKEDVDCSGFHYYFDLDSVRKPHKTGPTKFNIRVRDAQKGILKEKYGELYNASEQEIKDYNEKEMREEAADKGYSTHSASRTTTGLHVKHKYGIPVRHELGKTPSDVYDGFYTDNAEEMNSPRAREAREGYEPSFYNEKGANPSDVINSNNPVETEEVIIPHFNRKYSIIENYFDTIATEEQAYWFGFLWGDGSMDENRVRIGLQEGDKEHLEKLKESLGSNHPLRHDDKNKAWFLEISSKRLAESLKTSGFRNGLPKISDYLIRHFIRGFFDAEGTIYSQRENEFNVNFTNADEELLKWVGDNISASINCKERTILKDHDIWCIKFGGTDQTRGIREYLYQDSNVFLGRKLIKFPGGSPRWSKPNIDFWRINPKANRFAWCKTCQKVIKEPVCPVCKNKTVKNYAAFPEELVTDPILVSCPIGGIVFDPFCGSGTTCYIARKLGRKYIGLDINEEYVQIARWRVNQASERLETFAKP